MSADTDRPLSMTERLRVASVAGSGVSLAPRECAALLAEIRVLERTAAQGCNLLTKSEALLARAEALLESARRVRRSGLICSGSALVVVLLGWVLT